MSTRTGDAPLAYKLTYAFTFIGALMVMAGLVIVISGGPPAPLVIGLLMTIGGFATGWQIAERSVAHQRAKAARAKAYAKKNGLTYEAKRTGLADEFVVLDGSEQWDVDAHSVVSGDGYGREVVSFDRRGEVTDTRGRSGGRGQKTYAREIRFVGGQGQLIHAARLAGRVPALVLRKRDGVDEEGLQVGATTVVVESAEFNERWWVRTDDERLAHAVLTPAMIARLLEDDAEGIDLCFEGTWVFSTQPAGTRAPSYMAHRRLVAEVAALVPEFVFDGRY